MPNKHKIGQMLLTGSILAASTTAAMAGGKMKIDDTRWISVGAGIRASVSNASDSAPNGTDRSTDFNLENIRLYIAGQVAKDFKFYFGTEKMWDEYGVLDAIMQYEPNNKFNLWLGRMLVPADRIEMNGPFYALSWNQYTVPLFPSDNDPNNGANGVAGTYGRDDGITAWGNAGKFQYAVGVFQGMTGNDKVGVPPGSGTPANQSGDLLYATRLAYNFLDKEQNPAYYTSSTYFGKGGDILTFAVAYQYQGDGYGSATQPGSFSGYSIDGLFEKPLKSGAAITIEGEYKDFEVDTQAPVADRGIAMFDGKSYFLTGAYLIGGTKGPGKYQPYIRYSKNDPTVGDSSDLTEVGLNYVINGHNLRLNLNYTTGDANASGVKGNDIDKILFGMQYQI